MSKAKLYLLAIIFSFGYMSEAAAEMVAQTNVTIDHLGSHSGNIFYLRLTEAFTRPCNNNLAYCLTTNADSCKSMLSVALTAKSTGKQLSDFRYEYDSVSNACTVWLVAID